VLLALLPGTLAQLICFGIGTLLQILLAVSFALALEALMLRLRRQPLRPSLGDLSAPLTAVLFALCLPPLAPWWIAAIGMAGAMVLAKHLYGGLGHNLFNPAMVGYAIVLVCFPLELSRWPAPAVDSSTLGVIDVIRAVLLGAEPASGWDALAQPTPLVTTRLGTSQGLALSEIGTPSLFGPLGGRGWEWIAAGHALGGAFLLWQRIIPWQVPMALIGTLVAISLPLHLFDPDTYVSPLSQILTGGLLLAAFFIATDPVSGCTTPRGRLLFGAGVALLTLAIRRWGAYPDGIAFAVLLMNCAAPWIDLHTRPRFYGENGRNA
jgi:electron transport complex protein RnfD